MKEDGEEGDPGGGGSVTRLAPPPGLLSPAPSATMSPPLSEPDSGGRSNEPAIGGGRLRFFSKEGRVLLELGHGPSPVEPQERRRGTSAACWVPIAKLESWPPPTVTARLDPVPTLSDQRRAVRSSPWPVDPHRRKQAAPRRLPPVGTTELCRPDAAARTRRLRYSGRSWPPVLLPSPRGSRPRPRPAAPLETLLPRLMAAAAARARAQSARTAPLRAPSVSPRKRPHQPAVAAAARRAKSSPGEPSRQRQPQRCSPPPPAVPAAAAAPPPARKHFSSYSIDSLLARPSEPRSPCRQQRAGSGFVLPSQPSPVQQRTPEPSPCLMARLTDPSYPPAAGPGSYPACPLLYSQLLSPGPSHQQLLLPPALHTYHHTAAVQDVPLDLSKR